jgi:hypothetical protein
MAKVRYCAVHALGKTRPKKLQPCRRGPLSICEVDATHAAESAVVNPPDGAMPLVDNLSVRLRVCSGAAIFAMRPLRASAMVSTPLANATGLLRGRRLCTSAARPALMDPRPSGPGSLSRCASSR